MNPKSVYHPQSWGLSVAVHPQAQERHGAEHRRGRGSSWFILAVGWTLGWSTEVRCIWKWCCNMSVKFCECHEMFSVRVDMWAIVDQTNVLRWCNCCVCVCLVSKTIWTPIWQPRIDMQYTVSFDLDNFASMIQLQPNSMGTQWTNILCECN